MDEGIDFAALPVVGRAPLQENLRSAMASAQAGKGQALLLRGELGTGKTHLCRYIQREAERRGFSVASGGAYRAEAGVPYALFSGAFLPFLRSQAPETLQLLSRGGVPELEYLFPGLAPSQDPARRVESETPGEFRMRVLWTFVELLRGLARRSPLCIVLEDLQWADVSSLEAVHFIARNLDGCPALLLLTRNELPRGEHEALFEMERSLLGHGIAQRIIVPPFTREETGAFLRAAFEIEEGVAEEFTGHLHEWTQGNPFFLRETLQALIRSGHLYRKGGSWLGWETREMELPRTVREAILDRLSLLSKGARELAELTAVMGGRAFFAWLRILSPLEETELLEELDTLVKGEVLVESEAKEGVVYDFRQNLVRETLLREMGMARSQSLHRRVAGTLEDALGEEARAHADTLAFHYLQAGRQASPSAIPHLRQAGRDALARFGNAEAARYLGTALDLIRRSRAETVSPREGEEEEERVVLQELARALSHMGQYAEAIPRWKEARDLALKAGAADEACECRRQIGIIKSYQGDPEGAIEEYDAILGYPGRDRSPPLVARTRLRRGVALEELGRVEEAQQELEWVLGMAEELQDPVILAQAHRALVLLHIWTGNPHRVRDHAARALDLAKESGALGVEFWTHWALAILEGLLGNTKPMGRHVQEAERAAEALRSPLLRLRSAEIAIEEAAATGQWDAGIVIGEQAVALARSLSQNSILPRVLVWTALIYLGRGEAELARPLLEEAWDVSGAGREEAPNVHAAIPAYIGKGYLALAEGKTDEAIRIGRAALAIADRAGYGLWTLHRLVPLLTEAYLWKGELEGAREMGRRLREGSSGIRHRLGLAWAQSCEALVTWLEGDPAKGASLMEDAARALEAIPMIGDAARLRRLRAGRLAEIGKRAEALAELERVHEIFLDLRAEGELEKTRAMFRELDARPPRRTVPGEGDLSPRETEIAHLVEERKSNKAIAKVLGISPRTVSTHLSNIYQKLGISSRGELADHVRSQGFSES